jgi:CubicO group peptidase (beta-lactamase class C family)
MVTVGAVAVAAATLVAGPVTEASAGVSATSATSAARDSSRPVKHCALPAGSARPDAATPEQENLDPRVVARAVAFASTRNRTNVQIYRNNCLVAGDPINPLTGNAPMSVFSITKSVVSMLAGIAVTQGRLRLDAPIGDYLPPGEGDSAHRAITVLDLLTETSGLKQATGSELAPSTVGGDVSAPDEALALPIVHRPGTYYEYSQRTPDLMAYVVQRAVGEDVQAFAQRELFGPIGIGPHDYYWQRDRTGHTYGHAWLYLPPNRLARLGLLMLNDGSWNGRRIISADYVHRAGRASATNGCFGLLFAVNDKPCITVSIPSRVTLPDRPLPGLFDDLYAMAGLAGQENFIIPDSDMLVTWTGVLGDVSTDPRTLLNANPHSELYYNFFRILNAAFTDPQRRDPVPYRQDYNLSVRPE